MDKIRAGLVGITGYTGMELARLLATHPSMKLTKERNGNAIAVYNPKGQKHKSTALKLLRDGRVNFALPADYREGKQIDKVVKTILDKIAKERDLEVLKAKEEKKKLLAK